MNKIFILIAFSLTLHFAFSQDEKKEDLKKISSLIKQLSDTNYQTRESATLDLFSYLPDYKETLEAALKSAEDLEKIERLEFILKNWELKKVQLANEYAGQARVLMDEKKYDDGLKKITQSIKIKKFTSTVIEPLLSINEHLGHYAQNIKYIKELLVEHEKDQMLLLNLGVDLEDLYQTLIYNLLYLKDYKQALDVANRYAVLSRFDLEAKSLEAVVLEQAGKVNEAEVILKNLALKNPDEPQITQHLISFNIRQNKDYATPLKSLLDKNDLNKQNDTFLSIYLCYGEQYAAATKLLEEKFVDDFKISLKEGQISSTSLIDQEWYFLMFYIYLNSCKTGKQDLELLTCYTQLDSKSKQEWPFPILGYYAGEISEENLIKAATSVSVKETREKLCEAHFYVALNYLGKQETDKAKLHLKKCVENNVLNFIEPSIAFFLLRKTK